MNYYPDKKFVVSPNSDAEEKEFTPEDSEYLYQTRTKHWEEKHGSKEEWLKKHPTKREREFVVSPDGTARGRELPRVFKNNWETKKDGRGGMSVRRKMEDVEQENWDKKDLKEEIKKARKEAESAYGEEGE